MVVMNRKFKSLVLGLGLCGVGVVSLVVVNEAQRKKMIDNNKNMLSSLSAEIDVYKKLGFSETDKAMEVTKNRMKEVEKELASLKKQKQVLFQAKAARKGQKERLQNLISLNHEMIEACHQEIQDYHAQGMQDNNEVVQTVYANVDRLVAETKDLEMQLASCNAKSPVDNAIAAKVQKLIAVNKKSLDLYKNEISEYIALGVVEGDVKRKGAKDRVNAKSAEIDALEGYLRNN